MKTEVTCKNCEILSCKAREQPFGCEDDEKQIQQVLELQK